MAEVRLSRSLAQAIAFAAVGAAVIGFVMAETPRGTLRGTVIAEELGSPLVDASVFLGNREQSRHAFRTSTDGQGQFRFEHIPAGSYQLEVSSRAHRQPAQQVTIREGETLALNLELKPVASFLELILPQQVFTPREELRVRCRGFAPVGQLYVGLYRVKPEIARSARRLYLADMLGHYGASPDKIDLDRSDKLDRLRSETVAVTGRDAEGVFAQRLDLKKLEPGIYLMSVRLGDVRRVESFMVTELALIAKTAPDCLLVYAVDLETGEPRLGVEVTATWDNKPAGSGMTDADGLVTIPLPQQRGSGELLISGRHGESWASVHTWHWRGEGEPQRVYCYTDRPAYRPGQKVYFKGIVRNVLDDSYGVPRDTSAHVEVRDDRDNLIHAADLRTNDFGSFHGELELSENARPGLYAIATNVAGQPHYSQFLVAEYRKPEWEVSVTTAKDRYVRGDALEAVVSAQYYYGSPVADAKVDYRVTRSPYWYWPEGELWGEEFYEWDDYYEGGEVVLRGTSTTDSAGRLVLSVPTDLEAPEQQAEWYSDTRDYRYRIEAEVTDASRRSVIASARVLVVQGEYRLELSARPSVLAPGDASTLAIRAVDYEGNPVPRVQGEVSLERSRWTGSAERFEREASARWQADESGAAQVSFTPKREGNYRVRATAKDARGNTIQGDAWLWVSSQGYFSFDYPYGELDLKADKDLYQPGDTAQVLINTELVPATALLTVEGPTIYESRLVRLRAKSTVARVKIEPGYLPNCWVSVSFVHKKRFISDVVDLKVSPERKALQIAITPDQPEYQPGQPAVYKVKTTTPEGQPVRAEVSLAVVDEAVHAIADDLAGDILKFFYPRRYLQVDTLFSFPSVYLSGDDKAGANIQTRKFFPDTAFWAPAVVTDGAGEATFRFKMPDSLTTWRATLRAATLDTRVGQTSQKTICTKPFLVRLEAPRFFTQEDQVRLAAIVHNRTERSVTAQVGIDAGALDLADKATTSGQVAAGETRRFEWQASAPAVGDTPVRVWAKAGELEDAVELTLPVLPKGRHRVEVRSGAADDTKIEHLQVRQDAIAGASQLTVRLTPSLASAMLASLEYLAQYPYGCVEQTLSSFLPDVIIMQMLDRLGIEHPRLRERLPKMVEAGLLKIYDLQRDDGGWGWWRYDKWDAWMTAYAVFGLAQARRAGFTVNEYVLGSGIRRLQEAFGQRLGAADRAYLAYVLAVAGAQEQARARLSDYDLRPGHSQMGPWGEAVACLARHELGDDDGARVILTRLWDAAVVSDGIIHWEGRNVRDGRWWSDIETTAMALSAACRLTPEEPRLEKVVRWLLLGRQGNHWYSTRDTAFVLYALTDYLAITGELQTDLTATVQVNGQTVTSRHFGASSIYQPEFEVVLSPDKLVSGPVELSIARTGTGRLYYTAELSQHLKADLKTETLTGAGLVIERSYHKLSSQLGADRRLTEQPLPEAQGRFRSGEVIEVSVTVRTDRAQEYLMLEDPIPAGCEVVDRGRLEPWEWDYWWADQVVRDELVAFAVTELPVGARTLKYKLVAQIPGEYCAMPTQAYSMYDPTVRATGTADDLIILP